MMLVPFCMVHFSQQNIFMLHLLRLYPIFDILHNIIIGYYTSFMSFKHFDTTPAIFVHSCHGSYCYFYLLQG